MYHTLWNFVNKISNKESAAGIYLAVNIICWTVMTVLFLSAGTVLLRIESVKILTNILCAGVYAGIIFGLIGGILFLQRRTGKDDF